MEKLIELLEHTLDAHFLNMTISNARIKGDTQKIKIRPILLKGEMSYQETKFCNNQVLHKNYSKTEIKNRIIQVLTDEFKQADLNTNQEHISILVSKKGKASIKRKKQKREMSEAIFAHNRKKQYMLQEGQAVDFLIELGVMTAEGKVIRSKYDKFRQINRFLEFVEDVTDHLPQDREIKIIDFGCGKSYLTFAMYYYLHKVKQYNVRITGLDLKTDVIHNCNRLRDKFGYNKLEFFQGDIANYTSFGQVDMVVTLHACDTATDYAIYKAVTWGAEVILSVPCCQHELNRQIKSEVLQPILKHGLIKERMAALMTDALRAELLEQQGYQVQILEFIDMEHTPKNLLIRAVKKHGQVRKELQGYEQCKAFLHADLTLDRLLEGEKM